LEKCNRHSLVVCMDLHVHAFILGLQKKPGMFNSIGHIFWPKVLAYTRLSQLISYVAHNGDLFMSNLFIYLGPKFDPSSNNFHVVQLCTFPCLMVVLLACFEHNHWYECSLKNFECELKYLFRHILSLRGFWRCFIMRLFFVVVKFFTIEPCLFLDFYSFYQMKNPSHALVPLFYG
jgi:hypothetical protein